MSSNKYCSETKEKAILNRAYYCKKKAGIETSASFKEKIIKHKTYKENIIIHESLQREGDN